MNANRVLVICHERIGPRMAGPAIRSWELSRVLAGHFQVTLAAPVVELDASGLELLSYGNGDPQRVHALESTARNWADIVIATAYCLQEMRFLWDLPNQVPLAADVWIPTAVESLAWRALAQPDQQLAAYRYSWEVTRHVAQHADFIVCAGDRQRDFWLGILAACGRLHPQPYSLDPDMRTILDSVPFGCPSTPPSPDAKLRGIHPGVAIEDRVILWSSGVWDWFDPLTLLRAMPEVVARHPRSRLVFRGVRHPDAARVPEMECARQARALSQELGLDGRHVFWLDWVPYAERGSYLLEADLGVALHRPGIEPRLAFRARLLDSIWAGLPMVLSRGDTLSEELGGLGLASLVDPEDVGEVAGAINALLDEPDTRLSRRAGFDLLRHKYRWEAVAEPLVRFCAAPRSDPGKLDALGMVSADGPVDEAALRAEIGRLEETVRGYQSGRVMRVLSALHRLRNRLRRTSG